ncbi:MAG: hypothetical protein KDC07_11725 [Chitinophagaceae bacterium]|nr:hypothetical protein [Chitinophagaceae bacterium]MCB9044569.1 hypothetical protein [Chitinophagales bacterium]
MRKPFTNTKAGFIGWSMLWSLILYTCAISICNWHELSGLFSNKKEQPVVYSNSATDDVPVRISLDSLQKSIHIADGVWHHLHIFMSLN